MGIWFSKKSSKETRHSSLSPNQTQLCEDEAISRLRKDLNDNTQMFLVNNILLSIQFYENFEREMEEFRKNQVSEREIELNKALAEYQKHCLLPDTVMECINERVRFRPFHGPNKFESQPLLQQRMFIVHDNIEILYEGETSEYSTVDGPVHRGVLEWAEHSGYVQVKQVEFLNVGKNEENEDSDINDADDEKDEPTEADSPKENFPKEKSVSFGNVETSPPSTPGNQRLFSKNLSPSPLTKETQFVFSENVPNEPRRQSETKKSSLKNKILRNHSFSLSSPKFNNNMKGSLSSENVRTEVDSSPKPKENDQDYGYTTLRRLTASKPLDEVRSHRHVSDITEIPAYCIKEIKVRKIMENDDTDSDDSLMKDGRRKPPKKKKIQDFYDIKKYFNSTEFVRHFGDVFERLYPILGFTRESFANAMVKRSKIRCEGIDRRGNKILYEIIPTVASSWPVIAYEWNIRKRAAIHDPNTKRIYQWPTNLMRKKIKSLQANVLPVGYVAKRGINENQEVEWNLAFPAAERYMETCMSHSQIRCYLFILALYKSFMEPGTEKLGLDPYHILNLIFWECEKNFLTWPEDRLGTKMIKILDILYHHLSKGYLPDYFVRERNLFESLPSKYLRYSQAKLHNIIENPAVHVILAMRNLRYTRGNFFPTLNFKSLYSIITEINSLSLINPSLANMTDNNKEEVKLEERNEFKENAISFWNNAKKSEDRERQWKRNLRKQIDLENKQKQAKLTKIKRESVDSIDLKFNFPKFDPYRKRCLLEFFILHFFDVANKCLQYKAYSYTLIILEHSLSLAILLGEEPSGELEARTWKMKINELIDKCRREQQAIPPVDDNRDSRNFTGVRFNIVDNHNLNMNNLQSTFINSNNQDEEIIIRKKKRPENITISADVHTADVSSPAKSTPSQRSIHLEDNNSLHHSTDL